MVHFDGRPVSRSALAAMGSALAPPHSGHRIAPQARPASLLCDGPVGLGCVRLPSKEDHSAPLFPFRHAATGIFITGDIQLYERASLCRSLDIPPPDAGTPELGALLVEAYLRWGESFPARLRGDFALAIWDPRRHALLLARDHLGCSPLHYAQRGSTLAFASDLHGMLAHEDPVPDLDPRWIATLLIGESNEHGVSPYAGIHRAYPGHLHTVTVAGIQLRRYWDLSAEARITLSGDAEYEEAFRNKLEEAVRIRVPGEPGVLGAELSGGLDSSAVAAAVAAVARERGIPLWSFSHVLADPLLGVVWPFEDERDWAEKLRRHAAIEHHVAVDGDGHGILDSIRSLVRQEAAPHAGGYAAMPDALYDSARAHGVTALFSGFGGDEMVSSAAILVAEGWIRRGDWAQLRREWRDRARPDSNASRLDLLRELARLRLRPPWSPSETLGSRRQALSLERARQLVAQLPLTADFAQRWALHERIEESGRVFAQASRASDPQAFERFRIQHEAVSARLEAGNLALAARGMTFRYPLLDIPLLEFYHAVPAEQKWRMGWGRYLFRRSIAGLVPESLRLRQDKLGATIPNALARFGNSEGELKGALQRAKQHYPLDFLEFDRLERWIDDVLTVASGRDSRRAPDLFLGRLITVLGLIAYYELRDQGWRPGQALSILAIDDDGNSPA